MFKGHRSVITNRLYAIVNKNDKLLTDEDGNPLVFSARKQAKEYKEANGLNKYFLVRLDGIGFTVI